MNVHPKKKGTPTFGRPGAPMARLLVAAAVLFLVAGIAVCPAHRGAAGGSDGGTFQGATGLMSHDAAEHRATQCSGGGSALGVRPDRTRAI